TRVKVAGSAAATVPLCADTALAYRAAATAAATELRVVVIADRSPMRKSLHLLARRLWCRRPGLLPQRRSSRGPPPFLANQSPGLLSRRVSEAPEFERSGLPLSDQTPVAIGNRPEP